MPDVNLPDLTATQHIVLLQSLINTPAQVAGALDGLPPEALDWRPQIDEFTMRQVVAHLAAAEPLFRARLARMVAEDSPWLPYFGPDLARPDVIEPLADSLGRLRAERDQLLSFLSRLAPGDWDRPATHETMGATTLAQQVQNLLNHDLDHLGQLRQLRLTWEGQPSAQAIPTGGAALNRVDDNT